MFVKIPSYLFLEPNHLLMYIRRQVKSVKIINSSDLLQYLLGELGTRDVIGAETVTPRTQSRVRVGFPHYEMRSPIGGRQRLAQSGVRLRV